MPPGPPVLLTFGVVRQLGRQSLEELAARIGPVLGCILVEQAEPGFVYHKADLLGMQIELRQWHSPPHALAFLRGFRPFGDPSAAEIDISAAIASLLNESALGQWRFVTRQDMELLPPPVDAEVDQ